MDTAPGWYPDPDEDAVTRYWDGERWAHQRRWDGSGWVEYVAGTTATATLNSSTPGVITPPTFSLPKLPISSWLLFAGTFLAMIGVFLPWEQDSMGAGYFGSSVGTVTSGPKDVPIVAVILVAMLGGIVALAWPRRSAAVSTARSIGIAVVTALLWVLPVLKAGAIGRAPTEGYLGYSLGFGWFLTIAGLLAISVGCVTAFIGGGNAKKEVTR